MTNLIIALISGEPLQENLESSLAAGPPHPWGFKKRKEQMVAVQPGTPIAFIEAIDGNGHQVKRFTSANAVISVKRMVLAKLIPQSKIKPLPAPLMITPWSSRSGSRNAWTSRWRWTSMNWPSN